MRRRSFAIIGLPAVALVLLMGCGDDTLIAPLPTATRTLAPATPVPPTATPPVGATHPNIVFIILDDVGIDQLTSFGLGKGDLASTPNLDAVARAGVKFTNVWAMPECSPSRSGFFTGRYPLRTGVTSALIPNMLPQAQVSSYETAIPRVLATAGYKSALVGKYHLGNQNPAHNCAPRTLGWDYLNGNMEAGPPAIDEHAGHVEDGADSSLTCGYRQEPGSGACYFNDAARCGGAVPCCAADQVAVPQPDGSVVRRSVDGRSCLESGGLFIAGAQCEPASPISCRNGDECLAVGDVTLDFSTQNGYYVWPDATLNGVLPPETTDFSAAECGEASDSRDYMTLAQTSSGIDWYNQQTGPRMLSVSYNAIHTPYQQPPTSLISDPATNLLQCGMTIQDRLLGNDMLTAMDKEIGRLLAGVGLATIKNDVIETTVDDAGNTQIKGLQANNTMLVIVGDNGTLAFSVKQPFDASDAKGSVYQTGVWVPLIVAGPQVQGPTGRSVEALVNVVDLYELFAEMAGLKVRDVVPAAHQLDSQPMLAYLTNPNQPSIRAYNFTQLGPGVFEKPQNIQTRSWPCAVNNTVCVDVLFDTQQFCATNSGSWWGPSDHPDPEVVAALGDAAIEGVGSCCAVNAALKAKQMSAVAISPLYQFSTRNQTYKLVRRSFPACDDPQYDANAFPPTLPSTSFTDAYEFYDLTKNPVTNPVGLDATDLACDPSGSAECFTDATLKQNFVELKNEMDRVLASEIACPGDGNLDKRVNQRDLQGVQDFVGVGPSFFDFNGDGKTDQADIDIVTAHMNTDCLGTCRRSDLNQDGVVNDADVVIVQHSMGSCDLCGADVNGDGTVDATDLQIVQGSIGCTPSGQGAQAGRRP